MGTKLNIINSMLSAVGEGYYNTLSTQHPSVLKAVRFLDDKNEEFQTPGWWFNREYNLRLIPNTDGFVIVPGTSIECHIVEANAIDATSRRYVVRDSNKIYDQFNHSYTIKESILVNTVTLLPVEAMPNVAYMYLKALCTQQFYEDDDGDLGKIQQLQQRTIQQWQQLKIQELQHLSVNAQDRPAVQSLMYRGDGYNVNPRFVGGRRGY